ncbi:elongation factor P hydroxylase [Colwellia sp. 4_MG-2023]|jgi:elongation factor P hydroxylase|uniref:elongation factor P hydroxylase n=1 Tax=unclassified Colwellia TaxID=196834 RepID=UPI0026E32C30|nr:MULTISPECIES: elongation factor P hydroxylase [unclassified Colwellia]MDO6489355.1 elongation factor P hydroxylase [Colwellia sp. 6_MG-2023]MDO6507520.1 elongation factor P hydroxylase [Colwellia sp. 5_MG-2023]MDO6556222.1 elongation factor P hydroxylase [Colwellia sp. 4_MG-2023]
MPYHYQDLIALFDKTFSQSYNTRLIKGDDEPIYLPKNNQCSYNQIVFAHGYYESAFHEIAHWCHAGAKRRLLEDYGYWYVPDGRDEQQQAQFEQVEIIPQAIEWAFNVAVKKDFHVSSDNLNGFQADTDGFKKKVFQQVKVFLQQGFPARANQFIEVLANFYNTPLPLKIDDFIKNKEDK